MSNNEFNYTLNSDNSFQPGVNTYDAQQAKLSTESDFLTPRQAFFAYPANQVNDLDSTNPTEFESTPYTSKFTPSSDYSYVEAPVESYMNPEYSELLGKNIEHFDGSCDYSSYFMIVLFALAVLLVLYYLKKNY